MHATRRWTRAAWIGGSCALVAVVAVATTVRASAQPAQERSANPHHVVALTGGHSDFRNALATLAGDADWAVYEQLGNTDVETDYAMFGDPAVDRVYALNANGESHRLPFAAADQALQDGGHWSLVDDMLTLSFGRAEPVRWWDLAAGTHGEGGVPYGYVFGSSPDGWLLQSGTEIVDQPADGGAEVVLGSPAGLSDFDSSTVTSTGDDGYVVGASAGLLYSPWGPTSSYTTLQQRANAPVFTCGAEAYHAIACFGDTNLRDYVERIPTSGATAVSTEVPSDPELRSPSLSAHTTAWAVESASGWHLSSVPATGGTATTASAGLVDLCCGPYAGGPTGALGKFLVATDKPSDRSVELVASAAQPPTQVAVGTRALVHVDALVLTPGQIVYADDKHDAGFLDVYQRHLTNSRALTVGPAHLAIRGKGSAEDLLAASRTTIALVTINQKSVADDLNVVSGKKRYVKRISATGSLVVDGHDVIYQASQPFRFDDLNASTGKVRTLPVRIHDPNGLIVVDHELLYFRGVTELGHGQVWEYPLRGGKPHRVLSLSTPDIDSQFLVGDDHTVAVDYTTGGDPDDNNRGAVPHVLYRPVDGAHPQAEVLGPIPRHCTLLAIKSTVIDCGVDGAVVSVAIHSQQRRRVYEVPNAGALLTVFGGRVAWETSAGAGQIALLSSH